MITIVRSGNLIKIDDGRATKYVDPHSALEAFKIYNQNLIIQSLGEDFVYDIPYSQVTINGIIPANSTEFQIQLNAVIAPVEFKFDSFVSIGFATTPTSPVRRIVALGNNPDVDSGTVPEDIWSGGGLYSWMTTATSLEIVSDNANDTVGGTGARGVLINGLLGTYAESAQVIALNGLTPVSVPTQLLRIQTAAPTTAGSFGTNQGNIIVRDAGGGTTRAIIPAGYGITRQSQYTVPLGYTLQVVSFLLCINRPSGTLDATIATYSKTATGAYRLPLEVSIDGNPYRHDGLPGINFSEKTDFGFRCTFASGINMDVTAAFLGILAKNDIISTISYP